MPLAFTCPRCPSPVRQHAGGWVCHDHGAVPALWRPEHSSYDEFVTHLQLAAGFPTYLPWPLAGAWQVTDFAVAQRGGRAVATLAAVSGITEADGPVEVLVVSEEPGVGLGARCAGTIHSDPGAEIDRTRPAQRVRVDLQTGAVWPITTPDAAFDRSVLAGEVLGRWLWLVLRPASGALLLTEGWALADLSSMGASLLEVPFGGPPPRW